MKLRNAILIITILLIASTSFSRTQTSKIEEGFDERRNVSYWSVETTGIDKGGERRRLALVINFKGHNYKKPEQVMILPRIQTTD